MRLSFLWLILLIAFRLHKYNYESNVFMSRRINKWLLFYGVCYVCDCVLQIIWFDTDCLKCNQILSHYEKHSNCVKEGIIMNQLLKKMSAFKTTEHLANTISHFIPSELYAFQRPAQQRERCTVYCAEEIWKKNPKYTYKSFTFKRFSLRFNIVKNSYHKYAERDDTSEIVYCWYFMVRDRQ